MKKLTLLIGLLFTISFAVFAFAGAGTPHAKIRIVNLSALGVEKELTDEELVRLADIHISENPEIFPEVANFVIKMDEVQVKYAPDSYLSSGALAFSGSMEEKEMLEFISLLNHEKAGKFDVAIVKADGTVVKIDKEVVVDYKKRSIKTYEPLTIEEGDVVLTFVRDVVITALPDGNNDSVGDARRGRTPNRPGRQPNNPRGGGIRGGAARP